MKARPEEFSRMGRARAWLEYVPIRAFQIGLRLLPRRAALAAGRLIGLLAYAVDARHRVVARTNLRACLPEAADPRTARRIARRAFQHFGTVAVECLLLASRRPADLDRMIVYEGLENLKAAHLEGKGVLLASAHIGNWEIAAVMQGWVGIPIAIVTRPLDNPLLERLLARGRSSSGNEIVHKRRAVRGVLKALKDGWSVAILIDQDFPESDRIFVPFLGRPAAAAPTVGLMAVRTGAPVVPVTTELLPDGRYRVHYFPALAPPQTGDRDADILDIMSRCTALIEQEIRRLPDQWLWMHRRWKTQPRERRGGAAEKVS